ncbi:MAG: type VI secretion system membrane subunit TssM [Pseudomonadota bacterium]
MLCVVEHQVGLQPLELVVDDAEHFDAETVKAWILLDWDSTLPRSVGTEERQRLREHLDAQMEKLPVPLPVALDQRLIDDTRRVLMRIPLAERVYGRLKRQRFGSDVPPFTIADAGGRDAPLVFQRKSGDPLNEGIPGLYTYKGYHEFFVNESERLGQRVADESWILGEAGAIADQSMLAAADEPNARDQLFDDVLDLYLEDFGLQYQDLLADLALQQPNDLGEAVELLRLVSDKRFSPLLKVLQAVEKETSLQRVETEDEGGGADEAAAKVDAAKNELANTLGTVPRAPRLPQLSARQYRVKEFVDAKFKGIHEQVSPDDAGNFRFQSVMDMLDELYRFLDTVKNDPDAASAMMQNSGKVKSLVNDLRREAVRQPPVVEAALSGVTDTVTSITSGGVRQHLNALWRTDALGFCQRAIDGRYPLERDAVNEVQLGDFGEFFSPGGIMDRFFRDHLMPYVDSSRTPWRWRAGSDMRGASSRSLAQFERARTIRETFFRGGSKTPRVQFELKPQTMDISIDQFVLEVEGQQVTYNHGPAVPSRLEWPGAGARQVRVQMSPPAASGPSGMTKQGAWAWFRLLDDSRMTPTDRQERFNVTFSVGSRSAQYELSASSAFNPFRLEELEAFRCPERF